MFGNVYCCKGSFHALFDISLRFFTLVINCHYIRAVHLRRIPVYVLYHITINILLTIKFLLEYIQKHSKYNFSDVMRKVKIINKSLISWTELWCVIILPWIVKNGHFLSELLSHADDSTVLIPKEYLAILRNSYFFGTLFLPCCEKIYWLL